MCFLCTACSAFMVFKSNSKNISRNNLMEKIFEGRISPGSNLSANFLVLLQKIYFLRKFFLYIQSSVRSSQVQFVNVNFFITFYYQCYCYFTISKKHLTNAFLKRFDKLVRLELAEDLQILPSNFL